ncbi:hypothetical protein FPOAC1_003196 [Fusarium poae]|uniref:hypothetical protein n=1 Tax=Fusarium poae TaxID=36050 RepID=UPI001CE7EAC7|nr:hypothetical protein FPOAC1_003196 [Fusarium poae]KAG8677184.1 hypothetical protein FPOAC1_003196 [Fusarium poae]
MGLLAGLVILLDLLHFWIKLIFPTASYMPLDLIICFHKDMGATLYKICSEASSIIVISESNAWSSVLVPVLQPPGQAVHEPPF